MKKLKGMIMNKGITQAISNAIRLNTIEYRMKRGLIPRDSDLFFVYNLYMELKNEREEKLIHKQGTDRGIRKGVRKGYTRRSKKERVREGDSVRSESSNQEDNVLEGGA